MNKALLGFKIKCQLLIKCINESVNMLFAIFLAMVGHGCPKFVMNNHLRSYGLLDINYGFYIN